MPVFAHASLPWRRGLYLIHRWLGIGTGLLFVLWFVSGLVMMYVRFPALSEAERLAGLPQLDLVQARLGPDQAWRAAGMTAWPGSRLWLEMMVRADGSAEPVWRSRDAAGRPLTIAARDGGRIDGVDLARATAIAQAFAGGAPVRYLETRERDQWTMPNAASFEALRPLYRFAVAGEEGLELYVSARNGQVVRDTRRSERGWSWLGTILHYYTFAALREQPGLWRQTVLWTSGLGIVAALSGLIVGWWRLRLRRRYRGGHMTPHRGWKAWHHLAGMVGGVFVLTWVASGWLSMTPAGLLARQALSPAALAAYAGERQAFPWPPPLTTQAASASPRELEVWWFDGWPLLILREANGEQRSLPAADGSLEKPEPAAIAAAARRLLPGAELAHMELQTAEDRYWYSRRQPRMLPVWRLEMNDAEASWLYVDPDNGRLLAHSTRAARLRRWLFNAAHSLDFPGLLQHPLVWEGVLWCLSLLGMVVCASGVLIGWRHLRRQRRPRPALAPVAPSEMNR